MSNAATKQPVFILFAAFIGLVLGRFTAFGQFSTTLIEPFLMLLLFMIFVSVDWHNQKRTFEHIRYTSIALLLNFVLTPFVAFLLGKLFFLDALDIRIGLLMLLVTPCTDWYLVFTSISKGNVALNLSILPINLLLQVVLMPVYLFVFLGSEIQMNPWHLAQSIVMVLLIPFALSFIVKRWIGNKEMVKEWFSRQNDFLQLLFLCFAVIAMFASEGQNLLDHPMLLCKLFVPLLIFFGLLFWVVQMVGKVVRLPKEDIIALHFTTLARNSPLSLAIAVVAFAQYPLTSLALVIGPLIELPVLSIVSSLLLKWNPKTIGTNPCE